MFCYYCHYFHLTAIFLDERGPAGAPQILFQEELVE